MRVLCLLLLLTTWPCLADPALPPGLQHPIAELMRDWAKIQYQMPRESRDEAFHQLAEEARALAANHPQSAEPLIWEAVALASYAQVVRGRTGLKLARQARDLLLQAERINPLALSGGIYITLGRLYFKVPGWPISFGNKRKARTYLQKALEINPTAIEANCFYADLLSSEGDYTQAITYYQRALKAPPRPGQEVSDAARRRQAEAGLQQARERTGAVGIFSAQGMEAY